MLDRWKVVENPVDRLGSAVGMQGREHEMSGFCRRDDSSNRLRIPHLSHHDDVGILANRIAKRFAEVGRVDADLALGDTGLRVREEELDRIFDRDDVNRPALAEVPPQRRQRGRFATPRRPWTSTQTHRQVAELQQGIGQLELLNRLHVDRDHPKGRCQRAALQVDVAAEVRRPGTP